MDDVDVSVVDLNSDLGESFGRWELGDDSAMLRIVTSANVACGFHAGDPSVLERTCRAAADLGVSIGAQVSYRDLAGFGRDFIDVPEDRLRNDVLYQLGALQAFARLAGTEVAYLKPHGALYHACVTRTEHARAVVDAVRSYSPTLAVLGLPGSQLLELAQQAGLPTYREAFADRAYTPEAGLVSRREPGAVLGDPETIAERCVRMVTGQPIEAIDGSRIQVHAESICVHGDTPAAVQIARAVRDALGDAGIDLRAFTAAG